MNNVNNPEEHNRAGSTPVLIEDELQQSFLDYAMSVIVSRAIPDIRDGLKPVHRRVLYTMHQLGFHYNRSYHKSVRVVGEVLGRFHPHGDSAVYNTMVGMVQNFSKRYPLLDGQGNWGSIDGDAAAAMRYTEIRMQRISQELLADIDKHTVPFVPNFDESTVEPAVLPSKIPHLLVNGTMGIAVGMATAVPPHNLGEVIDACLGYLKNPDLTDQELFTLIPAPDFPTGGIICGRGGIYKAYTTGRGNMVVRGVVSVEENKRGSSLVITELPYQVIKAELIIKIADLVKNKVIEGITNIKDESDRQGMRIVIDIKRGESPQVILNQLYKFTPLQTSIAMYMLGLLDNAPRIFTLRQLIHEFLGFRQEVVLRRSTYDRDQARARAHILQGFVIALTHIDEVVQVIKLSRTSEDAAQALLERFSLTEQQSKALLELRLARLTGLEQDKIHQELVDLQVEIERLQQLIDDPVKLQEEIARELAAIKSQYADVRRTRIEAAADVLSEADLIPDDAVVVTLTHKGYTKRVVLQEYSVQHRGGKGKMGMADLDAADDILQDFFVAHNHDQLLFFTNLGRIYKLQVFEIPESSRTAKGRAIINLLPLAPGERVVKLLCARDLNETFLAMVTRKGTIKRTAGEEFAHIRSTGIRAITLNEGDELAFCALSSGTASIILATAHGQGIRFIETEVRAMGRQAAGVMGIRLLDDDEVVGLEVVQDDADLLFATQYGFGKRVRVSDFRVAHRAGQGVRTIPTEDRNGKVIGLAVVTDTTDLLLIDQAGKIIRVNSKEVRTMGRQAKGVRLIRLDEGQSLAALAVYDEAQESPQARSEENIQDTQNETDANSSGQE
jgi:DNA gyrase subunit A